MKRSAQSLLLATCLLWPTAHASEGITPNAWFYELNADDDAAHTARIIDVDNDGIPELKDGGVTTMGVRQNCDNWKHTPNAPYMGLRAYSVRCVGNPFLDNDAFGPVSKLVIRSEQHVAQGWRAGPDSQRSLSFAFRLSEVAPEPRVNTQTKGAGSGWIAQFHGEGLPFVLAWQAHTQADVNAGIVPAPGYYLYAGAKYGVEESPGTYATYQPFARLGRLTPGQWNRVMVQIDLGKGNGKCTGASGFGTIGNGAIATDASWTIAIMDNATGRWGQTLKYPFPEDHQAYYPGQRLGNEVYLEDVEGTSKKKGGCLHLEDQTYNFKLGQYVVLETNRLDYDNITYGKRWINVTKNHLVGYQKSVLRLAFEETAIQALTNRVEDSSFTWNGGKDNDPTQNYDNDGIIVGQVGRINDPAKGRVLRFLGTGHVKVPIGPATVDDFDVGNYMTVSAWFRTEAKPTDNRGLVMIDEFSDTWKLLLYMRGNGIAFGVRHRVDPGRPGVYSRLDHEFPMGQYAKGGWHLLTGTFNRFDPGCEIAPRTRGLLLRRIPCERIKLYIDGKKVMGAEGRDLPILRGENQLVVGKYSERAFFEGDIDDVGLFNYAMIPAQVEDLYRKR